MSCVTWCDYEGPLPEKTDPDSQLEQWEINLSTFSNWFRNEILGMLSGETPTFQASGTYYIACHTTTSSSIAPGTELTGKNYSRSAITFTRVSDIKRWNPTTVVSAVATEAWDDILSFTLWDSPTGGNYYAFGNLTEALSVEAGKGVQWPQEKVIVGMGS